MDHSDFDVNKTNPYYLHGLGLLIPSEDPLKTQAF